MRAATLNRNRPSRGADFTQPVAQPPIPRYIEDNPSIFEEVIMRHHTRTGAAGVVAALVAGALCFGCSADDPNVSLEMRIAQNTPADDLTKMTMRVWGGQRSYYVHDEVLLTEEDVEGALVVKQDDGAPAMWLALSEEGQEKLLRVTQQNVGKRLGIIINGQLQCASPIKAPLDKGVVMVTGLMLERAAKRCSRALTRRAT
jgi:hypothetical protein